YKDDEYDRLWVPLAVTDNWRPFISSPFTEENSIAMKNYGVPFTVMNTAYTESAASHFLRIKWTTFNSKNGYFLYFHFSELGKLQKNRSREFNVSITKNSGTDQ
ncbi:Malectin-like carbohydrate-binding domain containing protein, partial [Parasponia andersonii]